MRRGRTVEVERDKVCDFKGEIADPPRDHVGGCVAQLDLNRGARREKRARRKLVVKRRPDALVPLADDARFPTEERLVNPEKLAGVRQNALVIIECLHLTSSGEL